MATPLSIRSAYTAETASTLAALLAGGAEGWEGLVAPIERMHHRLARAWSPVGHLNGVMNGDELRAAAEVLIAAHADPGYRPEDDPAFAGRIGAVLGEDV